MIADSAARAGETGPTAADGGTAAVAMRNAAAALAGLQPGYGAKELVAALNLNIINFASGAAEIPPAVICRGRSRAFGGRHFDAPAPARMVSHALRLLDTVCPMRSTHRPVPTAEWTDARHRRGLWGERLAMAHLTRQGWSIEAHRFRLRHHDLDIIARRGRLVAFLEVKTRGTSGWGTPAESVGWRKRRTIARVAEAWRARHGRPGDVYRFDVFAVLVGPGGYRVEHLEDAWRLGE
ncbi:MAG: YraN family protein [Gemmatimonadales bacterium]